MCRVMMLRNGQERKHSEQGRRNVGVRVRESGEVGTEGEGSRGEVAVVACG